LSPASSEIGHNLENMTVDVSFSKTDGVNPQKNTSCPPKHFGNYCQ
jgi:hypothetical protein